MSYSEIASPPNSPTIQSPVRSPVLFRSKTSPELTALPQLELGSIQQHDSRYVVVQDSKNPDVKPLVLPKTQYVPEASPVRPTQRLQRNYTWPPALSVGFDDARVTSNSDDGSYLSSSRFSSSADTTDQQYEDALAGSDEDSDEDYVDSNATEPTLTPPERDDPYVGDVLRRVGSSSSLKTMGGKSIQYTVGTKKEGFRNSVRRRWNDFIQKQNFERPLQLLRIPRKSNEPGKVAEEVLKAYGTDTKPPLPPRPGTDAVQDPVSKTKSSAAARLSSPEGHNSSNSGARALSGDRGRPVARQPSPVRTTPVTSIPPRERGSSSTKQAPAAHVSFSMPSSCKDRSSTLGVSPSPSDGNRTDIKPLARHLVSSSIKPPAQQHETVTCEDCPPGTTRSTAEALSPERRSTAKASHSSAKRTYPKPVQRKDGSGSSRPQTSQQERMNNHPGYRRMAMGVPYEARVQHGKARAEAMKRFNLIPANETLRGTSQQRRHPPHELSSTIPNPLYDEQGRFLEFGPPIECYRTTKTQPRRHSSAAPLSTVSEESTASSQTPKPPKRSVLFADEVSRGRSRAKE